MIHKPLKLYSPASGRQTTIKYTCNQRKKYNL